MTKKRNTPIMQQVIEDQRGVIAYLRYLLNGCGLFLYAEAVKAAQEEDYDRRDALMSLFNEIGQVLNSDSTPGDFVPEDSHEVDVQ